MTAAQLSVKIRVLSRNCRVMTLELSDQGESSSVLAPGPPRDPHLTNRSADRSYYCAPNIVYLTNALSRGRVITGDDLVRLLYALPALAAHCGEYRGDG